MNNAWLRWPHAGAVYKSCAATVLQVITVDGAGNPVQVAVEFAGTAVSGKGSPNITAEGTANGGPPLRQMSPFCCASASTRPCAVSDRVHSNAYLAAKVAALQRGVWHLWKVFEVMCGSPTVTVLTVVEHASGLAGIHKFAVGSSAPMLAVFTATADGLKLPQSVVSFQQVRVRYVMATGR